MDCKKQKYFDNLMRISSAYDAEGNNRTYAYDGWGSLNESTDPSGNLYRSEFDIKTRRVANFFVSQGNIPAYRANPTSNLYKENVLEGMLDQFNRVVERRAYPNWADTTKVISETYAYDIAGNLVKYTDPKQNQNEDGATKSYYYDELDRVIKVKDALNQLTEIEYTILGDIKNVKMRENTASEPIEIYTKAYDELRNLKRKDDPLQQEDTYAYNGLGLNTKKTDRNGSLYTYDYDEHKRIRLDKVVSSDYTKDIEYKYYYDNPAGPSQINNYRDGGSFAGQILNSIGLSGHITYRQILYNDDIFQSSCLNNAYDKADRLISQAVGKDEANFYTNYVITRLSFKRRI